MRSSNYASGLDLQQCYPEAALGGLHTANSSIKALQTEDSMWPNRYRGLLTAVLRGPHNPWRAKQVSRLWVPPILTDIILLHKQHVVGRSRQTSLETVTRLRDWRSRNRGSISGRRKITIPQTFLGSEAHTAPQSACTWCSFPGSKETGSWNWISLPFNAEVKNTWS